MSHFFYSISIMMISWMIGLAITNILKKKTFYDAISRWRWIKHDGINKGIGMYVFKFLLTRTWYSRIVRGPKTTGKSSIKELNLMRAQMTVAEIGHWIGFIVIFLIVGILKLMSLQEGLIPFLLVMNIFMNLYPSLLQQLNKDRIDTLILLKLKRREETI